MRNVIATLFQVAALGLIGAGLWLLSPLVAAGVACAGVGYVLAPDRAP
jgi:hypothetical protein